MKRNIIFIIGSNASGKTTLSRNIHDSISNKKKKFLCGAFEEGVKYAVTDYGLTAHVGKVGNNQCTGTDTLPKKENVDASLAAAIAFTNAEYILIDPIMATAKYIDMIRQYDVNLYLIYLHFETPEENFERVISRREHKTGIREELNESTVKNLTGKQKGFLSLYSRVKDQVDHHVKIHALESEEEVLRQTLSLIINSKQGK